VRHIEIEMFTALHDRRRVLRRSRSALERLLAHLPLFCELEAAALARLASGATELEVRRGAMVFRRGDPCEGLFAVVFGQVKLAVHTPQGGERVIDWVGPGALFGEIAVFLDRPYALGAEALADTRLLRLAKSSVFDELGRTPEFARLVIAALCQRLHGLIGIVEGYTLRSGTQRVIGYLLEGLSRSAAGPAVVAFPVKKGVIASRLNLSPEHFSRILRELAGEGLIEVNGREVRIHDLDALRARGAKEEGGDGRAHRPGAEFLSEFRC
jgi:CRP-like cAMP-binding protein